MSDNKEQNNIGRFLIAISICAIISAVVINYSDSLELRFIRIDIPRLDNATHYNVRIVGGISDRSDIRPIIKGLYYRDSFMLSPGKHVRTLEISVNFYIEINSGEFELVHSQYFTKAVTFIV